MTQDKKLSLFDFSFILFIGLTSFSFALNPSPNIDLAVVRILVPLFFLGWLFRGLLRKKLLIDTRFRSWLLVFILLFSLSSVLWAENTNKALLKILFLGSIFPVYWVAFSVFINKKKLCLFLKILFGGSVLLASMGLVQFFSQFIFGLDFVFLIQSKITILFLGKNFSQTVLSYNSWLVNLNGKTVFRSIGVFPDPHLFSLFLNISLPIGVYLFKKEKKIYYAFGSLLVLITSLLTFSRAGYLSLLIAFLFFWIVFLRKKNIWNILLALIIIVFFAIPNPIGSRFFSSFNFQDGSVSERLNLLESGIEITKNNPLSGVGIGNLSEELSPFSDQRTPIYAHNLFLDFSTELGLIAGLVVLVLILTPLVTFFRQPNELHFLIAIIFTIVLIHSMFETPFYSVRLLPLILSLLAI